MVAMIMSTRVAERYHLHQNCRVPGLSLQDTLCAHWVPDGFLVSRNPICN